MLENRAGKRLHWLKQVAAMDQQLIYLEMYKECSAQGRHHETQRSTTTTVCFAFAGAAVAFIAKEGGPKRGDFWLCVFLMILGVTAAVVSYKQYERFRLAMDRAAQYRDAIDKLPPSQAAGAVASTSLTPSISSLKTAADQQHDHNFFLSRHVRLHWLWTVLFLLIATLGARLTYLSHETSPGAPTTTRQALLTLAVMFGEDNLSSRSELGVTMDQPSAELVDRLGRALSRCEGAGDRMPQIEIRGFASTLGPKGNIDLYHRVNLDVAQRRANNIKLALERASRQETRSDRLAINVAVRSWNSYDEMRGELRFRDRILVGYDSLIANLTRRVEIIVINAGACEDPGFKSK